MEDENLFIPELKAQIPASQVCALEAAATILGRTWKSKLREMWMSGDYGVLEGHSAALQNFRNSNVGGPAGLNKYVANLTYRQEIQNKRDLELQEAREAKTAPVEERLCDECDAVLGELNLKLCENCRHENENCLEGMECPACGQSDRFTITFTGSADVTDDGSDDAGDHEWDEKSDCICAECNQMGIVKDFKRGTSEFNILRKEAITKENALVGVGEKPTEKEYIVKVMRLLPQYLDVRVKAKSVAEAEKLALEKSGDLDFGNGTTGGEAEYSAQGVKES